MNDFIDAIDEDGIEDMPFDDSEDTYFDAAEDTVEGTAGDDVPFDMDDVEEVVAGSIRAAETAMESMSQNARFAPLPIDDILFNEHNDYEMDDVEIGLLADDIARNGMLHNPVVSEREGGKFVLISGEKRIRAIKMLRSENENDHRWDTVMANIYTGLTPRQELILMDSANLQARGLGRQDKMFRKAVSRYIDNVKEEWGLTEKEAIDLTEQLNGMSQKSIKDARTIETKLNPALGAMLDSGEIKKSSALRAAALPEDEQSDLACEMAMSDDPDEVLDKKVSKKTEDKKKKKKDDKEAPEAPVTSYNLPPDERLRREYLDKFNSMTDSIRDKNTPDIVAQIRRLDDGRKEGEDSILTAVITLVMAAGELRDAIRASNGDFELGRDPIHGRHMGSKDEEGYVEGAYDDWGTDFDSPEESNDATDL